MDKVKQPAATAVCRSLAAPNGLAVDRVASLDPGRSTSVDVVDVAVPPGEEEGGRGQAALAAVTDGEDWPIGRHLAHSLFQLSQRQEPGAGNVALGIFPALAHVEHERGRLSLQALAELIHLDGGDLRRAAGRKPRIDAHPGILTPALRLRAWRQRKLDDRPASEPSA